MKQIVFTLSLAFIAATGFSQKSNVTNAALAYKSYEGSLQSQDQEQAVKDIIEAKEYIDKAAAHADTKDDAKCLMYLGKINIGVAFGFAMDSTAFTGLDVEKTMNEGFTALKRSKEVDTKGRYVDDVDGYANYWRVLLANQGITAYGEQKYEMAMAGLLGAAKYGEVIGLEDSMYYFYGGQAALMEKEYEAAEVAFKECVRLNYVTGESVSFLASAMKEQGKVEEAEKEMAKAVALYPDNLDLLIRGINFYLDQEKIEEAANALNAAIKLAPDNTALLYSSGGIYESMGRMDDAETAYNKTLEIDPAYTDAKFSLGVLYFNKGADANNEANTFDFNDPQYDAKYNAKIEESKGHFAKSVEYLENASAEKPEDIQILEALKSAYGKAGLVDKFKETKAKIAALQG